MKKILILVLTSSFQGIMAYKCHDGMFICKDVSKEHLDEMINTKALAYKVQGNPGILKDKEIIEYVGIPYKYGPVVCASRIDKSFNRAKAKCKILKKEDDPGEAYSYQADDFKKDHLGYPIIKNDD